MPKSKKQRYEEAVTRNIKNASKKTYEGKSFAQAKQTLGIRNDDEEYDDQVTTLVKTKEKKKKD